LYNKHTKKRKNSKTRKKGLLLKSQGFARDHTGWKKKSEGKATRGRVLRVEKNQQNKRMPHQLKQGVKIERPQTVARKV